MGERGKGLDLEVNTWQTEERPSGALSCKGKVMVQVHADCFTNTLMCSDVCTESYSYSGAGLEQTFTFKCITADDGTSISHVEFGEKGCLCTLTDNVLIFNRSSSGQGFLIHNTLHACFSLFTSWLTNEMVKDVHNHLH